MSFNTIRLILVIAAFIIFSKKISAEAPQRVIALAPHIVEQLYLIGAGSRIIGTTSHADYPEQAKNIPIIGNYSRLQVEKIFALKPDLIIAWQSGNSSNDLLRLKDLGLSIIFSEPKELDDVAKEMQYFGKVLGLEDTANYQADRFLKKLNAIQKKYFGKSKVRVFYELFPKPLTSIARQAWPMQMLKICGAENVIDSVANDYPTVSLERVFQWQPQVIIQPLAASTPQNLHIDWNRYTLIPAVKNQQIIQLDADKLHRMSERVLGELINLCEKLEQSRQFYSHDANSSYKTN
ncbi:MAG: cobalamin-binding protein [Pseudomonadota bacterium]